MRLDLATPTDSEELNKFFEQFHLKGLVDFKLKRPTDFFAPYRFQGENFHTYILRDKDNGEIGAMASFIFRDVLQDEKLIKVAYATDLRVSPNRKAILEWSQHFLPVLKLVKDENQVSHVFSAINLTDPTAMNAFVRPRTMRRPLPRYFLYRKFQMVSLHGRFPWAQMPLPHLTIQEGSEQNIDALLYYLKFRSQFRPFASVWDRESLKKKISRLPGFTLKNFLIAFDANKNVVGCVAPWKPQEGQEWIPTSYTAMRAHNFRQFLKFAGYLGWTRPISKPIASTGLETPLSFHYLTHVVADNEDIFESLLWHAYERVPKTDFLLYAHCNDDYRLMPPESWIAAEIPHALYAVIHPDMEPPDFLHPSHNLNPELEACYLW